MVEYSETQLDKIFHSLADQTRRDIVERVARRNLTISQLATDYQMSFAAVAKHIHILENAELITKKKQGKERIICANAKAIKQASDYIAQYQKLWTDRFDRLEKILNT